MGKMSKNAYYLDALYFGVAIFILYLNIGLLNDKQNTCTLFIKACDRVDKCESN